MISSFDDRDSASFATNIRSTEIPEFGYQMELWLEDADD